MTRRALYGALALLVVGLFAAPQAHALPAGLGYQVQGAPVTLAGAPDYDWWYGCSPTSAGMMMGYYDRNGYGGFTYDNLVPGGEAELSNYGNPGALANQAIASNGHINDFYRSGYLGSGDDLPPPHHDFDSLADFMGTSQDSVGNVNGSTTFVFYTNGARFAASDALVHAVEDLDGMYGMLEYFDYAGYGTPGSVNDFYTQLTNNDYFGYGLSSSFDFDDYKAEIDAGRVVMLHVYGHSMFGYGYDGEQNEVILHDTWTAGEHTMSWGQSYQGLGMWGVTAFTPTGGDAPPVPEPSTLLLLGIGLFSLGWLRTRGRRKH